MIFLCNFAPQLNRNAHETKTANGFIPTFDINFCTAQERRKKADEKKSNK